jgi:hypothetical protein
MNKYEQSSISVLLSHLNLLASNGHCPPGFKWRPSQYQSSSTAQNKHGRAKDSLVSLRQKSGADKLYLWWTPDTRMHSTAISKQTLIFAVNTSVWLPTCWLYLVTYEKVLIVHCHISTVLLSLVLAINPAKQKHST